jgi:hypothetical protein
MRLAPLRRGLFFGAYDRLAPLRAHIAVADLRGSDEGVDCIADRLGINRLYHACLEMDSRPTEPGLLVGTAFVRYQTKNSEPMPCEANYSTIVGFCSWALTAERQRYRKNTPRPRLN